LTSVNLKQAVETIFENVMMTWTYFALSASAGRGEAKFAFSRERDLGRCFRYMSDRGISAAYTMFSEALGERIPLRYVHFMHEPPVQLQPYKDLFRCPIHFGGERSELCFDEEWMYRRLPQAEGSTHRIFSAQCRKVSRALTAHVRFSEIVRYNLLNDLAHYSYLKNIAERLSLSPRTVQRKLAQDKTSFTELVENVRRNLALEYLAESRLPICDIAERLGYGDTASFSHAFTRWVGHSPSKYRCQVYYWSHPD
jgi:AraC-like DNA-binding protein